MQKRDEVVYFPASGCELRLGRGTGGRLALELSISGAPYDVVVAGSFGPGQVRWTELGPGRGQSPPGGGQVAVVLRPGRLSRRGRRTSGAQVLDGTFWTTEVEGDFRSATVRLSTRFRGLSTALADQTNP